MNISFKELKNNFRRFLIFLRLLIKDKRVPRISKLLIGASIAYFISPIDLIPDFIPVLGQLDDLIIVPGLAFLGLKLIPKEVYEENYSKATQSTPSRKR